MWLPFGEKLFETVHIFVFSPDNQCAAFHLPVPQFLHVYKGRVKESKAGLHQGGLGCM